jgi:hypothetical protein
VPVLPFMERNDIFNVVQRGLLTSPPYVGFFVCPSSPPAAMGQPTLAYAGNCGSASNARRFDGIMVDTSVVADRVQFDAISEADGTAMTLRHGRALDVAVERYELALQRFYLCQHGHYPRIRDHVDRSGQQGDQSRIAR